MFKKGDRVLIGGKEASEHSYTTIVGKVGVYHKDEGMEVHAVKIERTVWYVDEPDVIPIDQGNDSLIALLRTEDDL